MKLIRTIGMLSEDSQTDTNRLRLIERQKKMLETRRLRQQPITATRQQHSKSAVTRSPLNRSSERLLHDTDSFNAASKGEEAGLTNPSLSVGEDLCSGALSRSNSPLFVPTALPRSAQSQVSRSPNEAFSSHLSASSSSPEDLVSSACQSESFKKERTEVESCGEEDDYSLDLTNSAGSQTKTADGGVSSADNSLNPLNTILDPKDLLEFATKVISPSQVFQCSIIRDKRGIDRSLYPTYYLHLQGMSNLQSTYVASI